jgi:hypothetical protein
LIARKARKLPKTILGKASPEFARVNYSFSRKIFAADELIEP